MLYKIELTKENVSKAIDFLIENIIIQSLLDGKAMFKLIAHSTEGENAKDICLALNSERDDIAITRETYYWDYDVELGKEEMLEYGWFLITI